MSLTEPTVTAYVKAQKQPSLMHRRLSLQRYLAEVRQMTGFSREGDAVLLSDCYCFGFSY